MNSTSGCRTSGSCASNLLPYSQNLLPAPTIPLCFVERTQAFFLLERRTRVTKNIAEWTFAQVSREVGLRLPGKSHGKGPRLHDLRHSFASRTLINWYRAGLDVEREIPKLASYLGHRSARDTYWYIEAVPELLRLATQRLEKAKTGGSL
jgi:integrase